jgi:5-methylcytosine-specific restriction endonuclease McrA
MQRKHCPANPDLVLTDRSNQQLLDGAKHLTGRHRTVTAHLIAHLAEIYARKLHVAERFPYLGDYCVEALGLSEDEGHRRAHAAVLAQKYPVILDMLLEGSIHLSTLRIIGKCLTPRNYKKVLDAARGKNKTELEHLAAALDPKPDVPTVLRKLPQPRSEQEEGPRGEVLFAAGAIVDAAAVTGGAVESTATEAAETKGEIETSMDRLGSEASVVVAPNPPTRASLRPLSPERYNLQITIDKETHDALRELQDLLRHQVPNGDLVTILQDTIIERRDRVKRQKFGHTKRPRKAEEQASWIKNENTETGVNNVEKEPIAPGRSAGNSRHIPAAVKREVWQRDKGRCAFLGRTGKRCSATGRLEFHHVHAYALGGSATVDNIALRCRTHNVYEGVALFGEKAAHVSQRTGAMSG